MFRILTFALLALMHPVHVSLLSIEYIAENKQFNGFLMVYYDDFLLDYSTIFGNKPDQEFKSGQEEAEKIIINYLAERVRLYAGKNELKPEIVDFKLGNNELKMELTYRISGKANEFKVANSILADIYNDQSNLLIFRYGSFEEGVKLTSTKREHDFKVK